MNRITTNLFELFDDIPPHRDPRAMTKAITAIRRVQRDLAIVRIADSLARMEQRRAGKRGRAA